MSDRTEAEIFGKIFKIIGETISRDRRSIADEVWELAINTYEINPKHMKCDSVLEDYEFAEKCESCNKITYQDQEHICDNM